MHYYYCIGNCTRLFFAAIPLKSQTNGGLTMEQDYLNDLRIMNSFRRSPKPNPFDDELPGVHNDTKAIVIWFVLFWVAPIVYLILS